MWYQLQNPDQIDTPALLIYPDRAQQNIQKMIGIAGDISRLRPHVKTHKMAEVAAMHLQAGIDKFKCATIAEAEMLASAGAKDVLLAYQPMGPRSDRLIGLVKAYPEVAFGCLLDDPTIAYQLSVKAKAAEVTIDIWIDINNGMNRSGIVPGDGALALYSTLVDMPGLNPKGLHVYDGHIRHPNFSQRVEEGNAAYEAVEELIGRIEAAGLGTPNIVAGGSPSFPVNALRQDVDLSPGTFIFWDTGYAELCPELDFEFGAVVMTRVLSKPGGNVICLDVGSKGAAPDKSLDDRIRFLNLPIQPKFVSQNEEHLVIEVENPDEIAVGDVWYGVPGHVCTTVNLYQEANVVSAEGEVTAQWQVVARDRRITI